MVREPAVPVVGVRVGAVGVGEQSQTVVEEHSRPSVVLVVSGETPFDVGEPCADAVLVSLQRRQVDGVSEVCREELVALGDEACSGGGEVSELLIPTGALLIERGIDMGGEVLVVVLANRDVAVGVVDQSFGDLNGYGAAGAGGLLRGAS